MFGAFVFFRRLNTTTIINKSKHAETRKTAVGEFASNMERGEGEVKTWDGGRMHWLKRKQNADSQSNLRWPIY